ncbi:MAG: hypothetical protein HW386_1129, partial [Gammaproteobacteria bacterium]|nr:hypothetical protein [Gammaproteobacteria bacterium]
MINLRKVWVVAQTEGRLTRRLTRYWVFLVLAYGVGLLAFFYYSAIHAFVSAFSSTVGLLNPRYLVSAIGTVYLTGFSIGIVFLGFDVRARDVRENIDEVLDARPLTNLELVAGRFIGLLLSAWIPVVGLVLLLQALGWLLPLLGSPVGKTIEPVSLIAFVFAMAIPGMAFSFALVFLITLLVRHRLIAALLSVGLLAGMYWAVIVWPAIWVPYVDFLGLTAVGFPSDIVPSMMRPDGGWLQRIGFFIVALGLVGMAAVIHPRLDAGKIKLAAAVSACVLAVGLLALFGSAQQRAGNLARMEHWTSAHAARVAEPVPDIQKITASVNIDPGRDLAVTLQLQLQAPPEHDLDHLLLTLNPGLSVDRAVAADSGTLAMTHVDGLLEIKLNRTLRAGESMSLELAYHGLPEVRFAYLDSALKLENLKATDAQVGILGYEPGIFDRRYVALMPGIYWLPAAGVDTGREDARQRPRDYFSLDLEVQVPSAWTVAGPGKRESLGTEQDKTKYRFAP